MQIAEDSDYDEYMHEIIEEQELEQPNQRFATEVHRDRSPEILIESANPDESLPVNPSVYIHGFDDPLLYMVVHSTAHVVCSLVEAPGVKEIVEWAVEDDRWEVTVCEDSVIRENVNWSES